MMFLRSREHRFSNSVYQARHNSKPLCTTAQIYKCDGYYALLAETKLDVGETVAELWLQPLVPVSKQ